MARDYKERTGLRSSDGEMIHIGDRISEEGAYVAVPVETLERVRTIIDTTLHKLQARGLGKNALCSVYEELFPEEGVTTKQEGGK